MPENHNHDVEKNQCEPDAFSPYKWMKNYLKWITFTISAVNLIISNENRAVN